MTIGKTLDSHKLAKDEKDRQERTTILLIIVYRI
jgi:hypothetical protein